MTFSGCRWLEPVWRSACFRGCLRAGQSWFRWGSKLSAFRGGNEGRARGVAHTLASGAVGLNTDSQDVQIAWSEMSNADDWSKNLIRMRCQGRYATSISSRWVSSNLT